MIGLNEFKTKGGVNRFYFVNLKEFSFDEVRLVEAFFKPFMELFRINAEDFIEAKNALCILDRDLYDFSIFESEFKVGDDLIYTEKTVKGSGIYKVIKTYYDVYLGKEEYASLALAKIARYIVSKRFPKLFDGNFADVVPKFSDEIKSINFNSNMRVSDLSSLLSSTDELTIGDVVNIMGDKDYINTSIKQPKFELYINGNDGSKCSCYLNLEKDVSIEFDIESLYDKNWKAIEDKEVWVSPKNKLGFFRIKQKDRDYFSHPLVKEFKETFFL